MSETNTIQGNGREFEPTKNLDQEKALAADDTQKVGKGFIGIIHPEEKDPNDEKAVESYIGTDPTDLKAVVRVFDNKEIEATTADGEEIFAEAREKQRRRLEEAQANPDEEERDGP